MNMHMYLSLNGKTTISHYYFCPNSYKPSKTRKGSKRERIAVVEKKGVTRQYGQ